MSHGPDKVLSGAYILPKTSEITKIYELPTITWSVIQERYKNWSKMSQTGQKEVNQFHSVVKIRNLRNFCKLQNFATCEILQVAQISQDFATCEILQVEKISQPYSFSSALLSSSF